MKAGSLNSRIKIQERTTGQDPIGQPIDTWTDVATVWANVRHLSGTEAIKAGAESSIVRASIRIRYRTDIHAGMRVMHRATVYQITAVMPDERSREYTDLVCEVLT